MKKFNVASLNVANLSPFEISVVLTLMETKLSPRFLCHELYKLL